MTHQKTLSTRAWSELLLLSVIWGGSFLAIRTALDEIPFVTSVAYRVAPAAVALWLILFALRTPLELRPRHLPGFLGMGLLNNVIPFSLMSWGQLYIETGLTSIFNAATAIFGVLVAAMVFADERLSARKLGGVALGFAGVVTAIGLSNVKQLDLRSLAQLAVIGGTISYALAGAWGRTWLSDLRPQVAAAGMLTASSAIMVPVALWIDGPVIPRDAVTWAAIGYYALFGTAFAYLLYYRVMAMAGSGNVMLCTLMIAPVAIVLGAVVRGETLDPNAYAGFGLLALGLLVLDGRILQRAARPRSKGQT